MTQSKTRTAAVITVSDRCSRMRQQDLSGPAVARRLVPGLSELMCSEGAKTTPTAYLSRGVCAIVTAGSRSALVPNLPGSP